MRTAVDARLSGRAALGAAERAALDEASRQLRGAGRNLNRLVMLANIARRNPPGAPNLLDREPPESLGERDRVGQARRGRDHEEVGGVVKPAARARRIAMPPRDLALGFGRGGVQADLDDQKPRRGERHGALRGAGRGSPTATIPPWPP